ncbi:glycosyl transferase, group 2 family protein [Vibrio ishigakensis]|uniref:Glycosyl transferase, group 2 family protein n=1 Tax=Vibrio ishigakensis TaxID=1481914 RepID=A0A0B8P012_9VIBR|nr:glycosyltransferase family A protein [Vibrio ishigakensis]GAM59551.1 glycosyl transferase, group 2 family protein [Vibrio ishigakensis]
MNSRVNKELDINISAIIPLYNGSRTIVRALRSIENQTFRFKEVVIVNDGSSDDSVEKVEEFKKTSTLNIRILSQENSGVSCARNLGILNATSDYVAFLDCDDEWLPNKTRNQLDIIEGSDFDLIGGYHFPLRQQYSKPFRLVSVGQQLFKNYFQTSTIIVRRDTILKFGGFYEMQTHAEEGRFYFELLKFNDLVLINEQVVIYDGGEKTGFGDSGLSRNIDKMHAGEISNIKFARVNNNVPTLIYLASLLFAKIKYYRRKLIFVFKD